MKKIQTYEVVFAQGTSHELRLPQRAVSKVAAKEQFSRDYLGRVDATFLRLLRVVKTDDESEDEIEVGDEATCYWCQKVFTIIDPLAQQIGENIYWCYCTLQADEK